jgi:chemotaxis protein methyltransferase CheR
MPLSRESFEYVRAVLRERSASQLEDDKAYLVETRLLPVARRHGLHSAEELLARMRHRRNERLLAEVVEAMTIKETFFFRDGRPFDALRQAVFPELIRRRAGVRRLNIWSAACSSGQEPYSVAMLLCEHFPMLAGWDVRLIASDLSAAMLERARRGHYSWLEVSRGLPPELLAKYFLPGPDGWQVKDDLRRRVEFLSINLDSAWPALPPLDLVLLRNVLIYFDGPTRERILGRVERVLAPDGYLLLGGAETTIHLDTNWEPVTFEQTSLFRLKGRPPV